MRTLCLALLLVMGCTVDAGGVSRSETTRQIRNSDGTVTTERVTKGRIDFPDGLEDTEGAHIDDTEARLGKTKTREPANFSGNTLLWIGGMAFIAGFAVLFWLKPLKGLGYGLIVGGAGVMLFPYIAPTLATIGSIAIGIALVVLLLLGMDRWLFNSKLRRRADLAVAKLTGEGRHGEAGAIRRAIDPEHDDLMKKAAEERRRLGG